MIYKTGQKVKINRNREYYPEDLEVLEKTNFILTIKKRHINKILGKNMYSVEEMKRLIPKHFIIEIIK